MATVFSDFGAGAEEEEVAASAAGTDLAGAGLAGFGADFTTATAAGRATADCLLLDAAGTEPAAALETGFFAGGAVLALGVDADFCTLLLRVADVAGDGFFAGAALAAATFFTAADLATGVFLPGAALATAAFFTGVVFAAVDFEAAAFEAVALEAGAALAPAPFFAGAAFETAAFLTGDALDTAAFFAAPLLTAPADAGRAAFLAVA
ncbi:hypothetical protein FHY09_000816 [Xanthomonas sp. 60]